MHFRLADTSPSGLRHILDNGILPHGEGVVVGYGSHDSDVRTFETVGHLESAKFQFLAPGLAARFEVQDVFGRVMLICNSAQLAGGETVELNFDELLT